MDWFDEYLDELSDSKNVTYLPDKHTWTPAKPSKLQQSMIQDSMAFDVQQMRLIGESRRALESPQNGGGDSAHYLPTPIYNDDTIYVTTIKSSGSFELSFKTSTGYALITWWDGTVEQEGDGSNNWIVFSKVISNGATPKNVVLTSCNYTGVKSGNLTEVSILDQSITSFNTGDCHDMIFIDLQNNDSIETLNLTKCDNLITLDLGGCTNLYILEIEDLTDLQVLHLNDTLIYNIYFDDLISVYELDISGTPIASLDVSNLTNLEFLYAGGTNSFTSLILGNIPINNLSVINSPSLTFIDVSQCPNIAYIGADNCGLTSINATGVVGAFSLCDISISNNNLNASALNTLFNDIGLGNSVFTTIDAQNNPGSATCDKTIAEAKGWIVTV